jgi:hypothetical protein
MRHHLQYAHTCHNGIQLLACHHRCLLDLNMLIPVAYSLGIYFQVTRCANQPILALHKI